MASGWTNRGKFKIVGQGLANTTEPTNYYLALVTSATVPDADINTLSQLTEVAAGNGYTSGGLIIARTVAGAGLDWESATEVDASDWAEWVLEDAVWTASGGTLPASGSGARYAVLTDDNGTVGSREVLAWFDLTSDRSVSDTQTLTLSNCTLRVA
jgi:hypothetical protein